MASFGGDPYRRAYRGPSGRPRKSRGLFPDARAFVVAKAGMAKPVPPCAQSTKHFEDSWGDRSDINAPSRRGSYVVSALHARLAGFTCQLAHPPVAHVAEPTHEDFKSYLTPRAFVQAHRSPPPQNETTDTGQVDRYQREHAYDGTQMVRDARAFAYRLVHRVTQRRALPKQG